MPIDILTLVVGTAMIVFNGPPSRLDVWLQNWAWRAKHGERGIQEGKVANVLIGIRRDIDCNYLHDEGACNQLLNFLRLLPTSCYFDRR